MLTWDLKAFSVSDWMTQGRIRNPYVSGACQKELLTHRMKMQPLLALYEQKKCVKPVIPKLYRERNCRNLIGLYPPGTIYLFPRSVKL
jgi:hypothetical protein